MSQSRAANPYGGVGLRGGYRGGQR
jgi:hypothetical protein